MALPLLVDAVDDKVAQGVAFEAREIAEGMASGNSTYIQTFVAEYVDDLASTLRTLRACQGGSAAAVQRLTTTLAWREANKVYPAKKQVSSGELFVDSDGMVVVKTRQAALMANPASKQRGPSCVVPPGSASGSWKSYARAIETLEDARVALKSAYMSFRIIAQAAVVVPLESVSLSEINTKSILDIIDVAEAHYSSLVGRVYITATSSVLLEHARQSLWPVFSQLDPKYTRNITFVKAGMLPATHTRLEDFVADIRSGSGIRQQQVGFEGAQQDPGRSSGNVTTLDEFVKQTSSLHSGHTDTDADDFQSLYSDARDTGVRLDGAAGSRQRWVPSAKTSNRSGDGSVCSLGGYLDQMQFGNRASQLSMTTINKLPPTDLKGSCRYKAGGVGRATQGAGATRRDTLADSSRIGGGTKYNSNSSGGGSDDSESRRTLGSITPIQLASLQRAVQGVQQMLGSINDSIVSADSRAALATTRSKLAQQTEVLMSTVAALSFGVSMIESPPSGVFSASQKAFYIASRAQAHARPAGGGSAFQSFIRQLLAVPMSIMFGKPGSTLKIVQALANKAIHIVLRRMKSLPTMRTLLLLAMKHMRVFAMVFWTGALLVWQANAALIWLNLTAQWKRGVAY